MRWFPVLLLIPAPAVAQDATTDLMSRLQMMQARGPMEDSARSLAAKDAATRNPDAEMQDRLEALVMSGKCDEAGQVAKSYRNRILIQNVKQACEN